MSVGPECILPEDFELSRPRRSYLTPPNDPPAPEPLARIATGGKRDTADRPRLMGIYLNHANRPTGAGKRDAALRERQNGKFAQNCQHRLAKLVLWESRSAAQRKC